MIKNISAILDLASELAAKGPGKDDEADEDEGDGDVDVRRVVDLCIRNDNTDAQTNSLAPATISHD